MDTTGLDPNSVRVIRWTVANTSDYRTEIINPGVPVPPETEIFHGLTTAIVRSDGRDPEESLSELPKIIKGHIQIIWAAHYAATILSKEFDRYGIENPFETIFDPQIVDYMGDTYRPGRRTLSAVLEHYCPGCCLLPSTDSCTKACAAISIATRQLEEWPQLTMTKFVSGRLQETQKEFFRRKSSSLARYLEKDVCPRWPIQ